MMGGTGPTGALTGFEGQDFSTLLDERCAAHADRVWMTWAPLHGEDVVWTYATFGEAVRRFSSGLSLRGVRPGDRVLVHLDNSPEAILAWLGCAYGGVVAVTTNTKSTLDELSYFIAHSRVVAAVTQPGYQALVAEAGPGLRWIAVADGEVVNDGQTQIVAFDTLLEADAPLLKQTVEPLAHFGIQYTSGTTARPKAVVWTHANALWGAKVSAMHEGLTSDDVHLIVLPLFHTNAQVYSVLASLWAGGSIVVQPRFSASRFWDVSLRYRCTATSLVPFCVRALDQQAVPVGHSYRFWGYAYRDPVAEARYGLHTLSWWGMTETVTHGIIGSLVAGDSPWSMGRPSPAYEVIVRNEDGSPTELGGVGSLFIRGRRGISLFAGYLDDPQSTAAAFSEPGLLVTGDRVRVGVNGALFFADREKDMLKVGGENVAASEIEWLIQQVVGVAEVAVVATPDPMLDEVPVAFVIAEGDSDGLAQRIQTFCEKSLSSFKRPRKVVIVETLPRSTLNKVAKSALRQRLVDDTL